MLGYAFCGSFCTHAHAIEQMKRLLAMGYEIQPIMSETVWNTDTRFGSAENLRELVEGLCAREIIHTVVDAEPLGPKTRLDALIISPCTGNTLAKLANGITDTSVCMAAKAHLRSDRPLVISLASNDALSANLKNIATLLSRKYVYFVPMNQDDPEKKPHSLVADFNKLPETLHAAMEGRQFRRLFL
ncbi:MAG: dipicolinate synthase subunit B [Ruminococcaceae bacterium]|nr:dipicolinate synthase subunit B [Oscillospiraceae bacterium]